MALKRFIADWAYQNPDLIEVEAEVEEDLPLSGRKVAIIGSGPAGLTCAQDLNRQGCKVTVFEALPVPGGMMRVGIPAFRLPPDIVQQEVDQIIAQGVDLKLNHPVDDLEALLDEYDAVFVAIGAHKGVKLDLPGNDLSGVLIATDFLREVSLPLDHPSTETEILSKFQGKRVLVLGGGNVAIDSAMTARRLGAARVGMTCLEGRQQMPAHEWEIRDAVDEDIEIFPSRTFKEITGDSGQVTGVRTTQVNFRGFVDGRPDFDEIPGTEEILPADLVIFAIGQRPGQDRLTCVTRDRGGRIAVDRETLRTQIEGVFAGGDAVTGTAFIVDAIAAGHQAAYSIQQYLGVEKEPPRPGRPIAKLTQQEVYQQIKSQNVSPAPRTELLSRPSTERISDFKEMYNGLSEQQAKDEAQRCLRCGVCSECNQCVYVCRANAIDHDEVEKIFDLNVGAVLLTPGLEPMPGNIRPEYGFNRFPNVVTSMQFERMLSASGPFMGVIQRPSDGAHPHKIAWIQCVGSRDHSGFPHPTREGLPGTAPYCSSVCCMYATKEAIIAKEHDAHIEPTIFYMDIRSFGKGFEQFIEGAKNKHGIRYVRCLVSSVKEVPGSQNLRLGYVVYEGENVKRPRLIEEEFDLVVLSVGLKPSEETQLMAARLNVDLNEFGFAQVNPYNPSQTSRPGVFVAGSFAEPKDIPESVMEASCAASQISAQLRDARGSLTCTPEYPSERDITDEAPRVGVFICHCGINIGAVVDVPSVVEYARTLPDVFHAEHNLYTCSQDTQENIVRKIVEHGLNRVVVASCTPRTHEPLFQDTLRQAGINPHLFEMANIREQDSWVHRMDPDTATGKAKELVAMSVAKARRLAPISSNTFDVDQHALVIGGGLAGMTAALAIAEQGYHAYLVEQENQLGGNLRHIYTGTSSYENPQELLVKTISAVSAEPRITLLTGVQVQDISGYAGQYQSHVRKPDGSQVELHHGVILVATGAREIPPVEYRYGEHPNIITQREFEGRYIEHQSMISDLKTIVMIQCVGSRTDEHPYCSRICCTQALKNALAIKELSPETNVVILYRDIRSYGFRESLHRQAREAGVIFLQYSELEKPSVAITEDNQLSVSLSIQPENEMISLLPDLIVLSMGIEAEPGNASLAQKLKVPLTAEGFFLEAHVKLAPVDFAARGVFLAGLAHSPRFIEESITQARAAAVRAVALLSKSRLEATPIIATVNPNLCAACGICVDTCPYGARVLEEGMEYAEVIEVLCQGCGACIAACPNKASLQKGFEFVQIFGMLDEVYA